MNKITFGICGAFLLSIGFLQSCDKAKDVARADNSIARVNDSYLSLDALDVFGQSLHGSKDSVARVNNFIEKWATKELLIDAAEFNLSYQEQDKINTLVDNFAKDLKIKAYLGNMVQRKIDTLVTEQDLQRYYQEFEKNMVVDDMLLKLSYVNVLNDNAKFTEIKKKFNSSNQNDRVSLSDMTLQMKAHGLNDSVWVDINYLYQKLPFLNSSNSNTYLSKNAVFQVEDPEQNSTYFVRVKDIKNKGEKIPYEYIKTSLRLLVLNQRKVTLLSQIQEDILNDAKNNNKYEVF